MFIFTSKSEKQTHKKRGNGSLAELYPEIAKEFHPTKNGDLTPYDITAKNGKSVWWLGKCGHEWSARVSNRTGRGNGCPYCSNTYPLAGFNDLATKNPTLASEWHPTKNGDLTPYDVLPTSAETVWWQCRKGHEWSARPRDRTNRGCPYCSGNRVMQGYNDFESRHPDIAKQWHPTKNGDLSPRDVTAGSNKKVWWICPNGHEYFSTVRKRSSGVGCPYCAGQKTKQGETDIATNRPDLVREWHPTKNGDLTPSDLHYGSAKVVWWQCPYGHEWQTAVFNRTNNNSNCPVCSHGLTVGHNDLESSNPALARQWHPTKNGTLTPRDVTAGSHKVVWWQCINGHEWEESVKHRKDSHCPVCERLIVLMRENPNYVEKPSLVPPTVKKVQVAPMEKSAKRPTAPKGKTLITGECGHKWRANRKSKNANSCPYCNSTRAYIGITDLLTVNPETAKYWHPTKNKGLLPQDVRFNSRRKVWWLGKCGHTFQMTVAEMVSHKECPQCRKMIPEEVSFAHYFPKLIPSWHPTLNGDSTPYSVRFDAKKIIWWQCPQGHEWQDTIKNRLYGFGCPYCKNQK